MTAIFDWIEKNLPPQRALPLAGVVSALLLVGAHLFERVGGLAPCPLCLEQREVHWVALIVFIMGGTVWHYGKIAKGLPITLGLMSLVYGYSTYLSGYHSGVEWKFWDGPPTCAGGGDVAEFNATDLLNSFTTPATEPIVSCTDAAWRMFGISMAGYNFLASLALFALLGWSAYKAWKA